MPVQPTGSKALGPCLTLRYKAIFRNVRETVATADRVLDILDLFKAGSNEWTVDEAAEKLELPASTVYRYFRSLSRAGLIYAYLAGRYSLGPAIVQLDREIRLHDPLVAAAREEMKQLAEIMGEDATLFLARLYDNGVMSVAQAQVSPPSFRISYERGRVLPIHRGAASKVILANQPSRALRPMLLRIAQDAPDLDQDVLRLELRRIREQGYAVTRGEVDRGVAGLSVPILGPDHIVSGSLSAVIRDDRDDVDLLIDQLIRSRKRVEAELAVGIRHLRERS